MSCEMSCENLGVDTSSLQNNPPILKYASEGFWRAKIFGQRSSRKMVDCLRKIHIFLRGESNSIISASCWTTQKNLSCVIFPSKRTHKTGGKIARQNCSKFDQQRERGRVICDNGRCTRCAWCSDVAAAHNFLSFFLSFLGFQSLSTHPPRATGVGLLVLRIVCCRNRERIFPIFFEIGRLTDLRLGFNQCPIPTKLFDLGSDVSDVWYQAKVQQG